MKIERLDLVVFEVKDINKATKFFSDLLGTSFRTLYDGKRKFKRIVIRENGEPVEEQSQSAITQSPLPEGFGIELIQEPNPVREGLRSIGFKVADLEQAKAEMKQKGIRMLSQIHVGDNYKQASYNPEDMYGVRITFIEYKGNNVTDAFFEGLIE